MEGFLEGNSAREVRVHPKAVWGLLKLQAADEPEGIVRRRHLKGKEEDSKDTDSYFTV